MTFLGKTLCTTLAVALLIWAPAPQVLAQEAEEAQAELQEQARREIEEIVITARKREESLQTVPVSISAFTETEMQAQTMHSMADLQWQMPNVNIDPDPESSSALRFSIRGMVQNDRGIQINFPVGVYVDGVAVGRNAGALLNMVDLERVEVLRGPQGTLFGRNTTGGALNMISKKPDGTFGGIVKGTYGWEYNQRGLDTAIQFPILGEDTLSARIAYQTAHRDPYFEKRAGDLFCPSRFHTSCGPGADLEELLQNAYRVVLNWRPTETLNITFQHDYTREKNNAIHSTISSVIPFGLDMVQEPISRGVEALAAGGALGSVLSGTFNLFTDGDLSTTETAPRCLQGLLGLGGGVPLAGGTPTNGEFFGCLTNAVIMDGNWEKFITPSNVHKGFNGPGDHPRDGTTVRGFHGNVDWDISESLNLKAIAAYRYVDTNSGGSGGVPYPLLVGGGSVIDGRQGHEQRQWSYELQLSGRALDDRLDYVVGGNYFWERGDIGHSDPASSTCSELFAQGRAAMFCILQELGIFGRPDGRPSLRIDEGTNYAFGYFAHANYNLTEKLRLTGGMRLTKERKETRRYGISYGSQAFRDNFRLQDDDGNVIDPRGPDPLCADVNGPDLNGDDRGDPLGDFVFISRPGDCEGLASVRYSAWTWEAGLDYQWTDDIMVYAKASRGFKSGGYPTRPINLIDYTPVDEEVVMVYEVGMKADWFDNRLRTNAAAFLTKYRDFQTAEIVQKPAVDPEDQALDTRITNAGRAEISGGEFEMMALPPIDGLTITGNIGLSYDNYTNFQSFNPNTGVTTDRTDTDFISNPRFTAGASASYVLPWRRFGEITLRADYAWRSQTYQELQNLEANKQDEYGLVNARVTLFDENRNFEYALFCRNCLDRDYVLSGIDLVGDLGYSVNYWGPPRVFGVQLTWRFGSQAI